MLYFARQTLELNARLGLPPLTAKRCMTYQCGCVCVDCAEREKLAREGRPTPVVQYPWEAQEAA